MTEWHKPADKLPDDNQECLLMPAWVFDQGLVTCPVVGPISWSAKNGFWLDIFASPEAGSMVKAEQVGLWTLWGPIAPNL